MKEFIKNYLKNSLFLKEVMRRKRARSSAHFDWESLIRREEAFWQEARSRAKGGMEVLVATSLGAHWPGTVLESLLAAAMTLRGANVHILLCDETLPACQECLTSWFKSDNEFIEDGPKARLCADCFTPAYRMYKQLGLTIHRYSEFLTAQDREDAKNIAMQVPMEQICTYSLEGYAVGEHAMAGALRFFARGTLVGEPNGERVLRKYFEASLLTTYVARRILEKHHFASVVFHHGIYVPQGLIGEAARKAGVHVVNWNPAYRKKCFIFSHDDTYHHTLMSEATDKWEHIPWTEELDTKLMRYLKSRWEGTNDWIWFHENPQLNMNEIANEIGIDFTKPCIGMLTNVIWDAQLHYPANAFPNMLDWVIKTIEYFTNRPDLQLIIRVHPAEIRGTVSSRQKIVDEIHRLFPKLASNIYLIPPESNISTYAAMLQCDAVIIYGTKTGVELTSFGIPVIVAGEAWIRNKGITRDATSVEQYYSMLDQLPFKKRMEKTMVERARKYAYHFFFRRMIPVACMEPTGKWPPYQIKLDNLSSLLPGRDAGLDIICKGILQKGDFIFFSETYTK